MTPVPVPKLLDPDRVVAATASSISSLEITGPRTPQPSLVAQSSWASNSQSATWQEFPARNTGFLKIFWRHAPWITMRCQDLRLWVPAWWGAPFSLDWAPYTGRYDLITPGSQDRFCVQSWRLWHEGWRIVGEMVVTPRTLPFTTSILAYFSWCLAEAWSCSIVLACCTHIL